MNGLPADTVSTPTLSWKAGQDKVRPFWPFPSIGRRLSYALMQPDRMRGEPGGVTYDPDAARIEGQFVLIGLPVRNQSNRIRLQWGSTPFVITLRDTDAFGELMLHLHPSEGWAEARSITIDRVMKGGVSFPSPRPEEQIITSIGSFTYPASAPGWHDLEITACERLVSVRIDGKDVFSFEDPDVAAGLVGIGTPDSLRVESFDQLELIDRAESDRREEIVRAMNEFCNDLDSEQPADIARSNSVEANTGKLTWRYPETGATLELWAEERAVIGAFHAGLYGNSRLLEGLFAYPEVTDRSGAIFHPAPGQATFDTTPTSFLINVPLADASGLEASMKITVAFTENATWFCTAEITDTSVSSVALAFSLSRSFQRSDDPSGAATAPAQMLYGTAAVMEAADKAIHHGFGVEPAAREALSSSFLCTDAVAGHFWKALSGEDTLFESRDIDGDPTLILHSGRTRFRWALMWMPYHRLNLTGYKKRMLHFIRYPETPVQQWRERPAAGEYPTDEELERYSANGVRAMVWHHTWTSSNFRKREGFVVNEKEMRRAMAAAHRLGIDVIPYIGIVPGRHPVLRYEDLSTRMGFDKNWDLQDFTFYSVAGRFAEFFPWITDYWCREYGIDGFYTDGGLALLDWGNTGLTETDTGGLSLEELSDRLYSRVRRVLRRRGAGFGLENWGGAPIHLAGPFYDCRMIGESFQETSPESYRDGYNPLLTGTPFKMYGMDLVARGRYNIAMAAVCMTDIQMCSGNYAWGNWPDQPSDWNNLLPFWKVLDSIDWDDLVDARPWWAQKLLRGAGFYAGHYTTAERAICFLANTGEEPAAVTVEIDPSVLPDSLQSFRVRRIYPGQSPWITAGEASLTVDLPPLHHGPVGLEIVPLAP